MARANMRIRRRRQKPTEPHHDDTSPHDPTDNLTTDTARHTPTDDATASPRTRSEINRANAQHSTGPKTDAGKARSSQNALRHGLFSRRVVLPDEDGDAFAALHDGLRQSHAPMTPDEDLLVERLAVTAWRRDRHERAASELFARMMTADLDWPADDDNEDNADEPPSRVAAWAERVGFEKALALVERARNHEERAHRTARLDLARVQRERHRQQKLAAECEASLRAACGTDTGLMTRELTSVLLATRQDADRRARGHAPVDGGSRLASFSHPGRWPAPPELMRVEQDLVDELHAAGGSPPAGCGIA